MGFRGRGRRSKKADNEAALAAAAAATPASNQPPPPPAPVAGETPEDRIARLEASVASYQQALAVSQQQTQQAQQQQQQAQQQAQAAPPPPPPPAPVAGQPPPPPAPVAGQPPPPPAPVATEAAAAQYAIPDPLAAPIAEQIAAGNVRFTAGDAEIVQPPQQPQQQQQQQLPPPPAPVAGQTPLQQPQQLQQQQPAIHAVPLNAYTSSAAFKQATTELKQAGRATFAAWQAWDASIRALIRIDTEGAARAEQQALQATQAHTQMIAALDAANHVATVILTNFRAAEEAAAATAGTGAPAPQ